MEPSYTTPNPQTKQRRRKQRRREIDSKVTKSIQSHTDTQTDKTKTMCKNSAHLASHIAGAEDNRVDESNNGAVDDESYDFSIISMHLNSIGFSLTTIFLFIMGVVILRYS